MSSKKIDVQLQRSNAFYPAVRVSNVCDSTKDSSQLDRVGCYMREFAKEPGDQHKSGAQKL